MLRPPRAPWPIVWPLVPPETQFPLRKFSLAIRITLWNKVYNPMGERNKRKLCSSSIPFRFRFISKMMETKECKEFEENNELFCEIDKWKSFDWLTIIIGRNKNVCKKMFSKKIIKMNFHKLFKMENNFWSWYGY